MTRLKLLLASLCMTVSTMASASVVYTWQSTSVTNELSSMTGYIELADWAVDHVAYQAVQCADWPCDQADAGSPILRFVMRFNNIDLGTLNLDPVAGTGYDMPTPAFDATFDVVGNTLANFSLFINTFETTLQVDGDFITRYSSDAPNCQWVCSGGTGAFVRAAKVPEPGSLALLALAGLGLSLSRKRARAA